MMECVSAWGLSLNTQLHPHYAPTYIHPLHLPAAQYFSIKLFPAARSLFALPPHLLLCLLQSDDVECLQTLSPAIRRKHKFTPRPPAPNVNAHCLSTWTMLEDYESSGASVMWPRYTPDVRVFSDTERRRKLRTSPGDGELPLWFPLLKLSAWTIYAFMNLGNNPSQLDKKKNQHREA